MIKPIETAYNGFRFRSRLEARWAVFFDALRIEYEYEPEGFDLGEAGYYLPDFWLPEYRYWIEIKSNLELLPSEQEKTISFAEALHTQNSARGDDSPFLYHYFYLCCGTPYLKTYSLFFNGKIDRNGYIWTQCPLCNIIDIRFPPTESSSDEESIYCANCDGGRRKKDNAITYFYKGDVITQLVGYATGSIPLMQAYAAARQARFEHGQIGAPSEW